MAKRGPAVGTRYLPRARGRLPGGLSIQTDKQLCTAQRLNDQVNSMIVMLEDVMQDGTISTSAIVTAQNGLEKLESVLVSACERYLIQPVPVPESKD